MNKKISIFCGILFFLGLLGQTQARGRDEVHRYTLLRDRTLIEREIKHGLNSYRYNHYFDLDLLIADGTREMITDIKNGIDDADNQLEKTTNVLNILNKNMNSEKYVNLQASVGIPLPYIKIEELKILPSLFVSQNFGIMTSIDNQNDPTNPKAQIYFKTDTKYGLATRYKWREDHEFRTSIYQLLRSDLSAKRTAVDIVDKGELSDFSELSDEQKALGIDFSYIKQNGQSTYLLEILELFPGEATNSDTKTRYGMKPLFHARYSRKYASSAWTWHPFVGIHLRQHYGLVDAFYAGTTLKLDRDIPFQLAFKMSNQFLTLIPAFSTQYFQLNYSFKTPYINPQDDIWVSAHHTLNIRFPFP